MVKRKRLPTGIQSFREIREEGYYYVDKTGHLLRLLDEEKNCFLSRPRRFGKTLLVDTLKALFECRRELFEGLAIHDHWDWDSPHPVLFFNFSIGEFDRPGALEQDIRDTLSELEREAGMDPATRAHSVPRRLHDLIRHLHEHHPQRKEVVILVDEYDKPILDVLDRPELAEANRETLRKFYSAIKGSYPHTRFLFVTGISMFAQTSLFSGPNILTDISLKPEYSTICGYTENDLDTVFAPELEGMDRAKIRKWYNGYSWLGEEKVYNPYDIMLCLRNGDFLPYWVDTGTPSSLFRMLRERDFHPLMLENLEMSYSALRKFEFHNLDLIAFLFQTGYLTIVERSCDDPVTYRLDYPNLEVQRALNDGLMEMLSNESDQATRTGLAMSRSLSANDFQEFGEVVKGLFASIAHQLFRPGPKRESLAGYESIYASHLIGCFRGAGLEIQTEVSSRHGDADLVLWLDDQVFVFEFKVADSEVKSASVLVAALKQIRDRQYHAQYLRQGRKVHLVGMVFGKAERNLVAIDSETLPA